MLYKGVPEVRGMIQFRTMEYPRDIVDELLTVVREGDPEDPPGAKFKEINDRNRAKSRPMPDKKTLEALLDVALAASLQPEESRFLTFGLAFIAPDAKGNAFEEFRFARPVDFCVYDVAKLAAATDPTKTALAVWKDPDEVVRIWGLVTFDNHPRSNSLPDGHPTYLHDTAFLLIRATAPGVLDVYHGQVLQLLYVRGKAYFRLESGRLQAILRDHAGLKPDDAQAISHVASRISRLGHGGTILLTSPGLNVREDLLDVPHCFEPASTLLQTTVREHAQHLGDQRFERRERDALDFVSRLSQIDGAVHLTSDLAIRGFGAKISAGDQPFTLMEEAPDGGPCRELPLSRIPGTRHRSAAMFCAQQPDQALAVVISQDGDVSLFGRCPDGSVLRMGPFALGTGLAVGG